MAIKLITGAPGSGKSFFAVKYLRDNFYKADDLGVYQLKKGVMVFANVESLKLEHIDLDDAIQKSGVGVQGFFTVEYQKKVIAKYGRVVYFIDECQRYFDEYFRDKDVIYFFEYHRHLGLDIYLVSQTEKRICRAIRDLAEYEIHAVRRMASVFGEFKYNIMCGGEVIDKKVVQKDRSIFRLYKSFSGKELEVVRNPIVKYAVAAFVLVGVGLVVFYFTFFNSMGGRSGEAVAGEGKGKKDVSAVNGEKVVSKVDAESPKEDRLVLIDVPFAAVGDFVYIPDPVTGELRSMRSFPFRFHLTMRDDCVARVMCRVPESKLSLLIKVPPPSTGSEGPTKDRIKYKLPQSANITTNFVQ